MSKTMSSSVESKYLRNYELREEIANLAGIESERDGWTEKGKRTKARPFNIGERRQLAKAVIGDIGPDCIRRFIDGAIESEIDSTTGHDLNAIIDAIIGLDMEEHGMSGQRGAACRFRRDDLKQILEYLEES